MIFVMMTARFNRELFGTKHSWKAWSADAATAFLQGKQARRLPIFLKPPNDGLIQLTNHWKAKLYRVKGNIYGLADAPATWANEVIGRLTGAQYRQHSFDQQVFYKVANGEIISIILVYVDDFIGLFRSDYDLNEIHALFRWGAFTYFEENKPVTFKGKELTMIKKGDRFQLKITMASFINSLDVGTIKKGRLQQNPALTPDEQKELRSVSGCLQWVSTQCRPEVSAIVGARLSIVAAVDAKSLYDALLSPAPNLNDKRTLVSVRAVQETLASNEVKWVPTRFQFSDGLTKVDQNLMLLFRQWLQQPVAILKETQQSIEWEQRVKENITRESELSLML